MSEAPEGDKIPPVGEILEEQPSSTTADNNSGIVAAGAKPPIINTTSPMDVDAKDCVGNDAPDPIKTTPQIDSDNLAAENKEAMTLEAPVASTPAAMSPPRDQDVVVVPPVAAAPPTAATMNDNIAAENISVNGVEAPIITHPMTDNNINSDAAVGDTSRNSPMNILAAVASVESPTEEEQHNQGKDDDVQMNDAGVTIPSEALAHNDIILSLKDSTYKTIMHQYFRKLEDKMQDGMRDEEEERNTKEEVFKLLKNAGGRLLTYVDHRRTKLGFNQVDEKTARLSEYTMLFSICFIQVYPRTNTCVSFKTEIGNDISRRRESKGIWSKNTSAASPNKIVLPHTKTIVPQSIFLSLKDDFYRENLFGYFRKLGAKSERQRDSEEEKRVKEEAYNFFKTSGGKLVKHNDWKKPELGFYEVDDEYARKSECTSGYSTRFFISCETSC